MKAFISYSHRDEGMLARFHTHLAMLRREGGIAEWFDRRILAGGEIDREIARELESAELFLCLVSPDFLNSRYCYDREMQRALELNRGGTLHIVPIVLEPCDWLASPLGQFKALPQDGKPISTWTNKDAGWLDVVTELRRLVEAQRTVPVQITGGGSAADSSSGRGKYRVKQSFDEIDRDDYRRKAFETVREFFEKSCVEINSVEGLRGRYEPIGPGAFTCTVINRMIKSGRGGTAHITVRSGSRTGLGDIYYSFAANASENTANGTFRVDANEYNLFLRADFFAGVERERTWSPDEAANRLWQDFIERAGTFDIHARIATSDFSRSR